MIKAIVSSRGSVTTSITVGKEIVEPLLQEKTVSPTTEKQVVTFDKGYNGLKSVEITESRDSEGSIMYLLLLRLKQYLLMMVI